MRCRGVYFAVLDISPTTLGGPDLYLALSAACLALGIISSRNFANSTNSALLLGAAAELLGFFPVILPVDDDTFLALRPPEVGEGEVVLLVDEAFSSVYVWALTSGWSAPGSASGSALSVPWP